MSNRAQYEVEFRYSTGRCTEVDFMNHRMLVWVWEEEGDNTAELPEVCINSGRFHHLNDDTAWRIYSISREIDSEAKHWNDVVTYSERHSYD
jgi:hypothetical protein